MVKYPDATASQIAEILERSDLNFCRPTSGHCTYVAKALNDLFSVDKYYVAVEGPHQKYSRPAHIAVMKNGTIIDAEGIQSEEYMRNYAVAGLKQNEVHKADWGPAKLSLLENMSWGDGETQLIDDIKNEIIRVSEEFL